MNRTSTHFFSGLAVAVVALATACSDAVGPNEVPAFVGGPDFAITTGNTTANNNGAGGTSLSLARPAGTVSGDFLLAQIAFLGGTGAGTDLQMTLSGWTLVLRTNNSNANGQAIWRRVAGNETGPYVFPFGSSVAAVGGITRYTDVDVSDPIVASGGASANSGSAAAPTLTATDSSKLVAIFSVKNNTTLSTPAGMTSVLPATTGTGITIHVANQTVNAGATGARTSTIGVNDKWVAQNVVLRGFPTVPAKPTALTASVVSPAVIDVTWNDNSSNETSFSVTRVTSACGVQTYQSLAAAAANATSKQDTGLDGTHYGYRYYVRACNGAGCSPIDSTNTVTSATTPATPGSFSATYAEPTGVTITWADGANEAGYRLSRRTMTAGVYGPWTDVVTAAQNATQHIDNTVSADTRYQYRIRSCNGAGPSAFTSGLTVWTGGPPPAAPTGTAATGISSSEIQITWTDASSDETHFSLQRSLRVGLTWDAWVDVATQPAANATTFTDSGLAANTKYRYRVRACSEAGCSFFSAPPVVAQTLN